MDHTDPPNPAWICNYITNKVWGEITYPLPNFHGCTEVISSHILLWTKGKSVTPTKKKKQTKNKQKTKAKTKQPIRITTLNQCHATEICNEKRFITIFSTVLRNELKCNFEYNQSTWKYSLLKWVCSWVCCPKSTSTSHQILPRNVSVIND